MKMGRTTGITFCRGNGPSSSGTEVVGLGLAGRIKESGVPDPDAKETVTSQPGSSPPCSCGCLAGDFNLQLPILSSVCQAIVQLKLEH